MQYPLASPSLLALFGVVLLTFTACKNRANTSSEASSKTRKINWTKADVENYVNQGACAGYASIISGYSQNVYHDGKEFKHYLDDRAVSSKRIALGLKLLNDAHAEYTTSKNRSTWQTLLASLNPMEYLPTAENYDWIKLQKYVYPLFQAESELAIGRDLTLTAQEQLSRLSLGRDSVWVSVFAKFFQTLDRPRKLRPLEAYLLVAPFNDYDPFLTMGQLGWSTFRDVRLADFSRNRDLVKMAKYLAPVFPEADDPQGQVYHFWGYAARRIGAGKFLGHTVSGAMSYYWERIAQNDPEDYYTDVAGKWFGGGLEVALNGLEYYKATPETLVTLAQKYWTERCIAAGPNSFVPQIAPAKRAATFQCMIEPGYEDASSGEQKSLPGYNHFIFMHETADTLRGAMDIANRCKAYGYLGLTHVWQMPVQDFGETKQRWERMTFAKWSVLDYQKDRTYVEGGTVRSKDLN